MLSGGSREVSSSLIYLSLPQLLASPGSVFTHWLLQLNHSQEAMGISCRKGKPEWTELKTDYSEWSNTSAEAYRGCRVSINGGFQNLAGSLVTCSFF